MDILVIDLSLKLSRLVDQDAPRDGIARYWYYVSIGPNHDHEEDILFKSKLWITALEFFNRAVDNVKKADTFDLMAQSSLTNGDSIAIFRSKGHFRWTDE